MGLLTSLFSFSNGQTIYPTDHKLTMNERKEATNKYLKKKRIPILKSLPFVDDYTVAQFRESKDVASKTVVLFGLLYVAHNEKTPQEIISYFKKYNLWDFVSPEEREYLEKSKRSNEENNQITWRIECINILLWSIGKFEKLDFPTAMCDFSEYKDLPNIKKDPTEWIEKARLRNTEEILNETDLIYRIHWAVRDASLNGKKIPGNINQDVVIERHFALNWLTMYQEEWDNITTDT